MAAVLPPVQALQAPAAPFQQQQQAAPSAEDPLFQALVKHFASGSLGVSDNEAHTIHSNTMSMAGGHGYLTAVLSDGHGDCKNRVWRMGKRVSSGKATTTTGKFSYDFAVFEDKLKASGNTTGVFYESVAELGGAKFMYDDLQKILAYPCSFSAEVVKHCNCNPVLLIEFLQNDETVAVVEVSNSYITLPPYVGGGAKFTRG